MPTDVNIIDIASFAGVSVSTVSRVINKHPDVSPATRAKVLKVIKEHNYIPNDSARNLKRESLKAIGVIVKGFGNPFFTDMLTVIQSELESNDYMMLLQQVDPKENEIDAALSLVKSKKPRGLIFLGGNFEHQQNQLALLDIPVVMATISVNKGMERTRFSSVSVDDYGEVYRTVERIIQAGHRRIAAIGYREDDKSISSLRIQGFLQAAQDKGLALEETGIAYAGEFTLSAGYRSAKELLDRNRFTCLFCISDILALGAMRAIHEGGHHIPRDISVVGFDGIELGRYSIPSLATVKQPAEEMAHKSVQILMHRLRKKAAHKHLVFQANFWEGESFSPIPADSTKE